MQTKIKYGIIFKKKCANSLYSLPHITENIIEFQLIFILLDLGNYFRKMETTHYFLFPFEFARNKNRFHSEINQ